MKGRYLIVHVGSESEALSDFSTRMMVVATLGRDPDSTMPYVAEVETVIAEIFERLGEHIYKGQRAFIVIPLDEAVQFNASYKRTASVSGYGNVVI